MEEGFAEAYLGLIFRGRKRVKTQTATFAFGDFHLSQGMPIQSLILFRCTNYSP
jgi:hypothetical protein